MEELLRTLLAGSTALTTLIGERLQWGFREQATALPAVTLTKISGGPLYSDEGEVGLDETRVQIDCWAASFTSATAVARAVREQLSGYFDANFRYISLDVQRDMREGGANQEEYEYRVSMDFIILHRSI
jgi:hypothetical protein